MEHRTAVNLGDKFEKVEAHGNALTVARLVEFPGLPPHAYLDDKWHQYRELLISVSALLDPTLYRRVQ